MIKDRHRFISILALQLLCLIGVALNNGVSSSVYAAAGLIIAAIGISR